MYSIARAGTLNVAVGAAGQCATSTNNGVTWIGRPSLATLTANNVVSVTWTGTLFVAVGRGNNAFTSPDGITWTSRTLSASSEWKSVVWSAPRNQLVAIGNDLSDAPPMRCNTSP